MIMSMMIIKLLWSNDDNDLLEKALKEDSVVVAHRQVLGVVKLPASNLHHDDGDHDHDHDDGDHDSDDDHDDREETVGWWWRWLVKFYLSQPLVQSSKILRLEQISSMDFLFWLHNSNE